MSFIVQPNQVQYLPATIQAASAGPYIITTAYTWTLTNFDSYVTYNVSTTNGSVSLVGSTLTYTPTTPGSGGFSINSRTISLTISAPQTWMALLSGAYADYGNAVANDSSNNVYVIGSSDPAGSSIFDIQIAKYDNVGTLQWQKKLASSGSRTEAAYGGCIDSSGNLIVVGTNDDVTTGNDFQIVKYDSSGSVIWQRKLASAAGNEAFYAVITDTSNNIYTVGYGVSLVSSTNAIEIVKYNSSGIVQFQRRLDGGSSNDLGLGISIDTSANIYIVGQSDFVAPGSGSDCIIAKYNSSGTIQWQRRLTGAGANEAFYACAVDSSANIYAVGFTDTGKSTTFYSIQIAKYNTSGTIQFQRRLYGASTDAGYGIAVDSSGNFYIAGNSDATGNFEIVIAKYNSSGTIQWQRRLGATTGIESGAGIALDSTGANFIVTGYSTAGGNANIFTAKFPTDGSKTGTYTLAGVSYVYAASSLTDAATASTDAATTLTDAATTLTDSTSTLVESTSTLTANTTPVP